MTHTILFPSSYFSGEKVDEDLEGEYEAVKNTNLFNIIIFHYDKWFQEGMLVLSDHPSETIDAIYRGWMMQPEQYEEFYLQLLQNNIKLITSPQEYKAFHIFPNIYPQIEEDTAKMICYPSSEDSFHPLINIEQVKKEFRCFMVKDFVKSVKGTAFPTFFTQEISQEDFDQWMDVFYKYRGDLFTGGICIKQYLDLKKYEKKTNEYRVFYVNNQVISVARNSNQGLYTPEIDKQLINKYLSLPSTFYTVDFAELEDGIFKIIEAGDGSVSGLSPNQDYEAFYRALYHAVHS